LLIWEWIALLLAPFNIADTIGYKILLVLVIVLLLDGVLANRSKSEEELHEVADELRKAVQEAVLQCQKLR
jgi:UPF0716 family protein affecting phage T7 exclusion